MGENATIVAAATAEIGTVRYAVTVRTGPHTLLVDEPVDGGGTDAGPSPFGLLLSSLGACTAITLRMYAERKGWPLGEVQVYMTYRREGETPAIERELQLGGRLDDAQRARMAEIAEKTPVTRALKAGIAIHTTLR